MPPFAGIPPKPGVANLGISHFGPWVGAPVGGVQFMPLPKKHLYVYMFFSCLNLIGIAEKVG